jgi:hypothetical protein
MPDYIYYDIIYEESDTFVLELTGYTAPITDVLFDNSLIDEVTGSNGAAKDILFDPATTNEIPNVLIIDFGFL